MKTLVIDRNKWCRVKSGEIRSFLGDEYGISQLKTSKGGYCCLGFYCKDILKIHHSALLGVGYPTDLKDKYFQKLPKKVRGDIRFWTKIAAINDTGLLSEPDKEAKIIQWFKDKLKIKVEFIN